MAEFNDDMRGALFREEDKKSEKAPDYRGNVTINGTKFKLAGWVRESKAGKKFLSLQVEADDGRRGGARQQDADF